MTRPHAKAKTASELAAKDARDPEVGAELARTAVANQLAILLIQYRVDQGLTQTALARTLGMSQPAVARLESGDHAPSLATLGRMSTILGITIRLELSPDSIGLATA